MILSQICKKQFRRYPGLRAIRLVCLRRSHAASLPDFEDLLRKNTKAIPASASDISFLSSPSEFYETLLDLSSKATKRVVISSLYLGNGPKELKLVETLRQSCADKPNLRVDLLFDYLRGSRREKQGSSVTVCRPLLSHPSQVSLSLLHVPMVGLNKMLLRGNWKEVAGVHHAKIYIFDDSLIMSGANLSDTYFSDRVDRYVVIRNKGVSNFYAKLVSVLQTSNFSCKIQSRPSSSSEDSILIPTPPAPSPEDISLLRSQLLALVAPSPPVGCNDADAAADVRVFPTIQFPALGVRHDQETTALLLEQLALSPFRLDLASGYMNLTDTFARQVMRTCGRVNLIAASPQAHGFWGAKGIPGLLPSLYSQVLWRLLRMAQAAGVGDRVRCLTFRKKGWSFHAKGMWIQPCTTSSGGGEEGGQGDKEAKCLPVLTAIGSPNFGWRSCGRDTESQVFITTRSPALGKQLQEERDRILADCQPVTTEDYDTAWIRTNTGTGTGVEQGRERITPVAQVLSRVLRSYM